MRHITICDMRVRIIKVPVQATHSHGSGDVSANALRREQILSEADGLLVGCAEAKAALEMALLDLAGKHPAFPPDT